MSDISIKDAFKAGPARKWLLGGAAAIGGYVWWTRVRTAGGGAKASGTGTGVTVNPDGSATGGSGAGGGASGDSSGSTPPTRPSTNVEWIAAAVAALQAPPFNYLGTSITDALNAALNSQPITAYQEAIVNAAISVVGTPPEGIPPIVRAPNPTPPTGGTSPPPVTGGAGPTTGPYRVKRGDTLESIAAMWHTTKDKVYARNSAAIEKAAGEHRHGQSSRGGPNNELGWWIFTDTPLYKP